MRMPTKMPRRRHLLLAVLLATLALATPASALNEAQKSESEALRKALNNTQNAAALSGCEVCQQTGMCNQAFHNQMGQFCHTLASGRPCCCPPDAECVPNVYNCRCRMRVNGNGNNNPPPPPPQQQPVRVVTTRTGSAPAEHHSHWFLFVLAILGCCLCCCCCHRPNENPDVVEVPAQPVPVAPVAVATEYGTAQPVYGTKPYIAPGMSQPAQPAQYAYGYQAADRGNSGNALAAGAVGGVAGLAGGMLLGSMLGDHGNREETTTTTTTEYFGGDTGAGGYYNPPQQATGNYEYAGDTGDSNNWDGGFAGDDGGGFGGDDGTFSGDC